MSSTKRSRSRTSAGRPLAFARADAIESAMQLFWKKGFPSVSARDLAAAMSIQRSSFYNTFDSRQSIFREAVRLYSSLAPDAALDGIPAGQPVVPVLVTAMRAVCRARTADKQARGCLICNSLAELVHVDAKLGPIIAGSITARIAKVEKLLARAERQGEVVLPTSVRAASRAYVAFLVGLNAISKILRDEDELWEMCKAFLATLGIVPERAAAVDSPQRSRR